MQLGEDKREPRNPDSAREHHSPAAGAAQGPPGRKPVDLCRGGSWLFLE